MKLQKKNKDKKEEKDLSSINLQKKIKCTKSDVFEYPKIDNLEYLNGFGNYFKSECIKNVLPKNQNNPQKASYGLFAEQLSGSSFTTPRVKNLRAWFYRISPSVSHSKFKKIDNDSYKIENDFSKSNKNVVGLPDQLRWKPFKLSKDDEKVNFIEGMKTVCGSGEPSLKTGIAMHVYNCNVSMKNTCFCNSDGDYLIVGQLGILTIQTEYGYLSVSPGEIAVIQRGMKFSVGVDGKCRGYIVEVYDGHFTLPDLGPIGINGLANPQDFEIPKAAFEWRKTKYRYIHKYIGDLFESTYQYSPFNVVGWHGNYVPYKYNLDNFCAMNSVTYDHADPSIFTVLTCGTNEAGVACCDFVIFPPRWLVQQKTFRPPYYHRNTMCEFMGNIRGKYDAKPNGFKPGSASLHSCMAAHGPDANTYKTHSTNKLEPVYMGETLAFMFESCYMVSCTKWALEQDQDDDYIDCWKGLDEIQFEVQEDEVEKK